MPAHDPRTLKVNGTKQILTLAAPGTSGRAQSQRRGRTMNNTKVDTNKISSFRGLITSLALMGAVLIFDRDALAARAPVNLGAAGNFAILAKSGISTVPPSVITGDIGVSPIASTAITGFSLIHAAGSSFATSTQVR